MGTQTAKIFMNGRSQAVCLSKGLCFDTDEVYITKQGGKIILLAKKPNWGEFFDTVTVLDDSFMGERIDERP